MIRGCDWLTLIALRRGACSSASLMIVKCRDAAAAVGLVVCVTAILIAVCAAVQRFPIHLVMTPCLPPGRRYTRTQPSLFKPDEVLLCMTANLYWCGLTVDSTGTTLCSLRALTRKVGSPVTHSLCQQRQQSPSSCDQICDNPTRNIQELFLKVKDRHTARSDTCLWPPKICRAPRRSTSPWPL